MGGYVTALIRFSDGSLLSKESWTNRIIPAMKTYEFLTEDKEYIRNSFHKDDSDFRCPSEYGLIFFDFLKKKVFSVQSYSNPGSYNGTTVAMRHEDSDINRLFENKMISKAVYHRRDKEKEININNITNINDFFIQQNKSLEILLKDNNLDAHSLSLYNLDSLYQDMIINCIKNPSSEDIVKWYQNINKNFTLNDFNNPENNDSIEKMKSDYIVALIKALDESGKNRLIDFWSFYINSFEYHHQHDSEQAFIDLKKHIEDEGIIFNDEENNIWKKRIDFYSS